jgi:hypothetical protein
MRTRINRDVQLTLPRSKPEGARGEAGPEIVLLLRSRPSNSYPARAPARSMTEMNPPCYSCWFALEGEPLNRAARFPGFSSAGRGQLTDVWVSSLVLDLERACRAGNGFVRSPTLVRGVTDRFCLRHTGKHDHAESGL